MTQIIVITGASSGVGALAAHALDRVSVKLLWRIGLADLLHSTT